MLSKYDAFCLHIFNYASSKRKVQNYKKIVYIKNIFENGYGRMHIPHSTPLDSPLAISYRNHLKNLAYFSHLSPLVLFFFTKRQSQKGGGGARHDGPSKYASEGQI